MGGVNRLQFDSNFNGGFANFYLTITDNIEFNCNSANALVISPSTSTFAIGTSVNPLKPTLGRGTGTVAADFLLTLYASSGTFTCASDTIGGVTSGNSIDITFTNEFITTNSVILLTPVNGVAGVIAHTYITAKNIGFCNVKVYVFSGNFGASDSISIDFLVIN